VTLAGASKLYLRRMEISDIARVKEIDRLSFALPWSENNFRFEVTENPASRPWVADLSQDGVCTTAAMAVIWIIIDEAHIGTIAVHPDFRQCGIGSQFLASILLAAKAEGAIKAFLEVRSSNVAARALYRKFGFFEDGVRRHYYSDNGEDAIMMTLEDFRVDMLTLAAAGEKFTEASD
jgi:ribosomal-protein-alanine N-acetyltransferase